MKKSTYSATALLLLFSINLQAQPVSLLAEMPPALSSEHEKAMAEMNSLGFIDDPSNIPSSEYMLEKMNERNEELARSNRPISPQTLGFQRLEEYRNVPTSLNFKAVPADIIFNNSENYIFPSAIKVTRLFTETEFGIFLIEQSRGTLEIDGPNLEISGNDAKFVIRKLRGDKWSTSIFVADGEFVYRLESNRRLAGNDLENFIGVTEEIISSR